MIDEKIPIIINDVNQLNELLATLPPEQKDELLRQMREVTNEYEYVLETFPNHHDIQYIVEVLESNQYHVLVTRMYQEIGDIKNKYYRPMISESHFIEKFFPFEEGFKISDLMNDGKSEGKPKIAPMAVIFAHKSRMTREQLASVYNVDVQSGPSDNEKFPIVIIESKDDLGVSWAARLFKEIGLFSRKKVKDRNELFERIQSYSTAAAPFYIYNIHNKEYDIDDIRCHERKDLMSGNFTFKEFDRIISNSVKDIVLGGSPYSLSMICLHSKSDRSITAVEFGNVDNNEQERKANDAVLAKIPHDYYSEIVIASAPDVGKELLVGTIRVRATTATRIITKD